jgi:FdhD protein
MVMQQIEVVRFEDGVGKTVSEVVVPERRISLIVDGSEIIRLLALPTDLEDLAAGFLFTETILDAPEQIIALILEENLSAVTVRTTRPPGESTALLESVRSVTTGCGRGLTFISGLFRDRFPNITTTVGLNAAHVSESMRLLQTSSEAFRQTGGVHSAALVTPTRPLRIADDIGRHNAVDKVIGWAFRHHWPLPEDTMLISTGRLSSEIVTKGIRAGVAFIASHSAPTLGAIQLAEEAGVTLIGFARGRRFNIYSHASRVRG